MFKLNHKVISMKKILFLTVFLILLTSLCTDFPVIEIPGLPSDNIQQTGITNVVSSENSDLSLSVDTSSSNVKSGRTIQMLFEIKNKQTYELKNVAIEIYDNPCFKNEENKYKFSKDLGTIKADQSKMWSSKLTADKVDFQKKCPIKFKTSYEANYSFYQDIAVLPSTEYYQKEADGTLRSIPLASSSTSSPFKIEITFGEPQPFLAGQTEPYYMYINYYNNGQGMFEDLSTKISPSGNINLNCAPVYDSSFNLNKTSHPITFIRNRATPTTCSFTTKTVPTMDIKSLSLTASYKYVLDNSISITVNPWDLKF